MTIWQSALLCSPGQPSFSRGLISPIAPKAVWRICIDCIQLWAVVVSKLLCETIMVIFSTTIQRAIIENIVQFSGLGLSQMDMSRTIGVSQGVTGSWEQQFYTGATWASSEDSYIKRRMYPSTHLEAEEFPLNWPESGCSWSGELGALSLSVWSKGVFTHYECNKSFYIITNVENYFCNICVCWFQIGTFSMLCSQSMRHWTKQSVQVSIHLVGKQRVSRDLLFLVHCSVLISQRRHSIMHVTNWELEGE